MVNVVNGDKTFSQFYMIYSGIDLYISPPVAVGRVGLLVFVHHFESIFSIFPTHTTKVRSLVVERVRCWCPALRSVLLSPVAVLGKSVSHAMEGDTSNRVVMM